MKVILLFAIALALTAAFPQDAEDIIVPESVNPDDAPVPEMELESLAMRRQFAALSKHGSQCDYHVHIHSTTGETSNKGKHTDKEMDMDFDLKVGHAKFHTKGADCWELKASKFSPKVAGDKTEVPSGTDNKVHGEADFFNACLGKAKLAVVQDKISGELKDFILDHADFEGVGAKVACTQHEKKIRNLLVGAAKQLAGKTGKPDTEFTEIEDDHNGRKTTHHRVEKLEGNDGLITYHKHSTAVPEALVSLAVGRGSFKMGGAGHTKCSKDGVVDEVVDDSTTSIGSSSKNDDFSCKPHPEDKDGKVCVKVPDSEIKSEKVRMNLGIHFQAKHQKCQTSEVAPSVSLEQHLKQNPHLKRFAPKDAIDTSADEVRDPENVEEGTQLFLQKMENAPTQHFQKPAIKASLEKLMKVKGIRSLVAGKIASNKVKNPRAVMSLLAAMGRAKSPEALSSLMGIAHSDASTMAAKQQALAALIQPDCYDHAHVIHQLSKLATTNPTTDIQWMALHVQHGLIANAAYCKQGHYGDQSEFSELLQIAREGLKKAVANNEEEASWRWMDAIGNSYSQHPDHTDALIQVASGASSTGMKVKAVQNLGRLFTPVAQRHLQAMSLSRDAYIRQEAKKAADGEMLATADPRRSAVKPLATTLVQTKSKVGATRRRQMPNVGNCRRRSCADGEKKWSIKYEKVWPMPADGDVRAEPKVGVEVHLKDGKPCLHGYAGVDGKAWTWTVSIIQAGGEKCSGVAFDKYISVLGFRIWPSVSTRGASSVHPQVAQFSQAGDQQGKCNFNVDAADLVAQIAYDKTFFQYDKTFTICGVPINGLVKLDGEIGVKCGYGGLGAPNIGSGVDSRCSSGSIIFAIPYAQASLTGELSLDLAVTKGGVGVNVILVKFSLPATVETFVDGSTNKGSCGGVYFKAESLGGKIYGFVDVLSVTKTKVKGAWWKPWEWKVERGWDRLGEVTFYEWSSPAAWTSNELKCKEPSGAVTSAAGLECAVSSSRSNNAGIVKPAAKSGMTMTGGGIYNHYRHWNAKAGFEETMPEGNQWRCDMGFGPGQVTCYGIYCKKSGALTCTTRSGRFTGSGTKTVNLPSGYTMTGGGMYNHYRSWNAKAGFEDTRPNGNGWLGDMGFGWGDFTVYVRGCKGVSCTTVQSGTGNAATANCPSGYKVTGCGITNYYRTWNALSAFEETFPSGNGCRCDGGFGSGNIRCYARCCK